LGFRGKNELAVSRFGGRKFFNHKEFAAKPSKARSGLSPAKNLKLFPLFSGTGADRGEAAQSFNSVQDRIFKGFSSPPQAAKCVRTIFRIQHYYRY